MLRRTRKPETEKEVIYIVPVRGDDGVMYVSHGVKSKTLEYVLLPQEPFHTFKKAHCTLTAEGYILKN